MVQENFPQLRASQGLSSLPTSNPILSHLLTSSICPSCGDLLCQGAGARGCEAAGMSQVTGGAMGAAVHLVFAARSLRRDGPNSVFAPSSPLICPCCPSAPRLPKPVPGAWGSTPRSHQA